MVFCHKFRAQDVAARYDYTVEFTGLGAPPPEKDVGTCTQIGVFVRKYQNDGPTHFEKCKEQVYKTVSGSFDSVRRNKFSIKWLHSKT